jgi:hypothetical protein
VTDEELVHGLWTGRPRLETLLLTTVREQLDGVQHVALEGVNATGGVLVELRFDVDAQTETDAIGDLSAAVIKAVSALLEEQLGTPIAVSASPEPASVEPAGADADADASSTAWTQIAPVLAAVGTGVGVIGFVTFVGGAVVWARLGAAGFPAAPALGVFPSQDLLVIGAETLVPQVLVAVVVVLALAFAYTVVRLIAHFFLKDFSGLMRSKEAALIAGEAGGVAMFVFVSIALLITLLAFYDDVGPEDFGVAVIVAGLCALVAAIVASRTRRFLYLAAMTFVLVGVFQGFLAYSRESSDERVRGAALIRDHRKAIAGFFVAEGSDRVYLARVDMAEGGGGINDRRSRLVGVAKGDVTDVAIGDRKPVAEALDQARSLAKELCELEPRVSPQAGTTVENCRTAPPGVKQP